MSSFAPQVAAPSAPPPDPTKHVRYTLGMVLGVDDFNQEYAYLSGRDQWMARDLIGYGTVCGLQVSKETDAKGPRVVVTEGVAVTPRGQLVRVSATQCAYLNDWLRLQQQQRPQPPFLSALGSPPNDSVTLYVVLCYRDCPTDQVPIPGEPCRDESEAMAASRLTDDFKLELRTTQPDQREEDALRDFVEWLSHIEFSDDPDKFITLEEFEIAIREAAHLIGPQKGVVGSPPDFMYGSPPATLHIPSAQACEYLRVAFRIWTTELRPKWTPNGCGNPPDEECLMLAELNVPVHQDLSGQWQVDDSVSIFINEERRPYLIHLRMLQEWLLCGIHQHKAIETLAGDVTGNLASNTVERIRNINVAAGTPNNGQVLTYDSEANRWEARDLLAASSTLAGDVTGDSTNTTVERIRNITVAPGEPNDRQVLMYNREGRQWQANDLPFVPSNDVTAEQTFGQTPSAGTSAFYSHGDHTHGTPPDPIPQHRTAPDAHTLGGDVAGPIGSTTVTRIQNVPVAAAPPPAQNQVLSFQNGQWQATNLPNVSVNAVEHPAGLPPYFIVAAGMVKGDGSSVGPVYNKLRAGATADGELTVTFSRYEQPQPQSNFQYIVKVLPVFNIELFNVPAVSFARFEPRGFVLHVTNAGNLVRQAILAQLVFMIEVSQFFAG